MLRLPRALSVNFRTVQAVCPSLVQYPIFLERTVQLFGPKRTFPKPQCSSKTCAAISPGSAEDISTELEDTDYINHRKSKTLNKRGSCSF